MNAGSRRFFTAFYDALSPLLNTSKRPTTIALGVPKRRPTASAFSATGNAYYGQTLYTAATWCPRSRYVMSRGFAGFCAFTSVPSSATCPTVSAAASTVVAETKKSCSLDKRFSALSRVHHYNLQKWGIRTFHTGRPIKRGRTTGPKKTVRRSNSSKAEAQRMRKPPRGVAREIPKEAATEPAKETPNEPVQELVNVPLKDVGKEQLPKQVEGEASSYNQYIMDRISHIHRPTKDAMLAAASGAFQRLRIHMKWSLIRQMRPYNLEDITAFFSWLFIGHVIWIVIGTTTFMSLAIFLLNSVFAQESLAAAVGNYLTKQTGVKIVFESAIVPRWKDNCIQFRNVFVSRRPGNNPSQRNVQKGSPANAAAEAAAAITAEALGDSEVEEEDTNYTQFDVTIETVNVTLSIARWMNGKGLLEDMEIRGVRGVIDRTHVHWPEGVDNKSYRHEHQPGDFEIESFKLEDLLVTVHQPEGFRPFSVSIFSCDLPQLRKQWLFYDFLSANNMSGSFDDSLFTIHPRQTHGFNNPSDSQSQGLWKKTSRLRIDGLAIDHLNRGITGPFSWIVCGNVDMVADVNFPVDDDLQFSKLVQDLYDRIETTVTSSGELSTSDIANAQSNDTDRKPLTMNLHVQLKDVRAAVPIFTNDLSYVNNALIRPIVAYINTRNTYIPITCRIVKTLEDFDGSWTVYDSGLMDELSAETYDAFARSVADEQARRRRMKKVGLWSLHVAAQVFLMAMAGSVA